MRFRRRSSWTHSVFIAAVSCPAVVVSANIVLSGNYSPAYNFIDDPWDTGGDLTIGEFADGTLSITNGSGLINDKAYLGKGVGMSGNLYLQGTNSTWNQKSTLYVGYAGDGMIDIYYGGVASTGSSYIAYAPGSTGHAAVGPGGTWNVGNVYVGQSGQGTLDVVEGGLMDSWGAGHIANATGSTGTATINGNGSTWTMDQSLFVGSRGSGSLNIENGGSVQVGYDAIVTPDPINHGKIAFSNGTLTARSLLASTDGLQGVGVINAQGAVGDFDIVVDHSQGLNPQVVLNSLPGQNITVNLDLTDPGAPHLRSRLGAGYSGSGSLTIAGGYEVNTESAYLGYHAGSSGSATISGAGSFWDISSATSVGVEGNGQLTIENGGRVLSFFYAYIGEQSGSNGTVTVTGAGSTWTSSYRMFVGPDGTGTLNIENDGLVEGGPEIIIGDQGGGGTINLTGGTLRMDRGTISVGNGTAIFNFTGGRLEGAEDIDLGQPFVQDGGTLAPGSGFGNDSTEIDGDYILNAGTVELQLGGAGNPYDTITAAGDIDIALLGTTLDLIDLGPMDAGTYTVIESTGGVVSGMFEGVTGLGVYNRLVDVIYSPNSVSITLDQLALVGDLDGDGFVGINDLNIVLGNWNQNVPPANPLADPSGDGFVGIDDLNAVLGNWNAGTPPGSGAGATIPEPSALMLMTGVAGALISRRSTARN